VPARHDLGVDHRVGAGAYQAPLGLGARQALALAVQLAEQVVEVTAPPGRSVLAMPGRPDRISAQGGRRTSLR